MKRSVDHIDCFGKTQSTVSCGITAVKVWVALCVYIYTKGYLFLHSEFSVLNKPKAEM